MEWKASGQSGQNLTSTTLCQQANVAANQKIRYAYDARERLRTTTYGDGNPSVVRTYTPDGLLKTIASDGGLWTLSYNKRRLLTSEVLKLDGADYPFGYTHTAGGHVASMTYPDGSSVAYAPNALGEATQVGNYATLIRRHPNGALKSFRYGNGIQHTTEQNVRGLPSRSSDTGTAGVLNDRYSYDENANVTAITDDLPGAFTRTLTYDDRDRLVTASNSARWGGTHSFVYDPLDNLRRSVTPKYGDWTHHYNAATQRLERIAFTGGGANLFTYGYDARGRVTARTSTGAAQTFTVDLADRVTQVGPGFASYRYDGNGRRMRVTKGAIATTQVYSQAGQLLHQSNPNTNDGIFRNGFQVGDPSYGAGTGINTRYIYLGRHLIAEDGTSGRRYIHTDGLGSPARTSGTDGVPSDRADYKPYGWGGPNQSKPDFTGHVADMETGLIYMQARYYDPFAGRFLAVDPVVASSESFNRYWYANNDPYIFVDPDGRMASMKDHPSLRGSVKTIDVLGAKESIEGERGTLSGSNAEPNHQYRTYSENDGSASQASEQPLEGMQIAGKKYKKPQNPNKKPPPAHRVPGGDRERNVKHPNGEEHSRRPKGGFRLRLPLFICIPCNIYLDQIEQMNERRLPEA